MAIIKRTIPLIIAFIMGFLAMGLMLSPHSSAQYWLSTIANWMIIIGAFAFFLGFYSIVNQHYGRIKRQSKGWGYSTFVLLGIGLMMIFALINNGISCLPIGLPTT